MSEAAVSYRTAVSTSYLELNVQKSSQTPMTSCFILSKKISKIATKTGVDGPIKSSLYSILRNDL
jgi:hypothetical protein